MSVLLEFLKQRTRMSDHDIESLRSEVEAEYFRRMDSEKKSSELNGGH
jgi:hypothetical protein